MSKNAGKRTSGSRRREAAITRKATQHHDFIGEAEAERKQAELQKEEHVEEARTRDAVNAMAAELKELAEQDAQKLRMPRSIDEGREMLQNAREQLPELPNQLREKARERLDQLPKPVKSWMSRAERLAGFLLAPARLGVTVVSEVVRVPAAMVRALRQRKQEA